MNLIFKNYVAHIFSSRRAAKLAPIKFRLWLKILFSWSSYKLLFELEYRALKSIYYFAKHHRNVKPTWSQSLVLAEAEAEAIGVGASQLLDLKPPQVVFFKL